MKETVLIVDENPENVEILEAYLAIAGYDVIKCQNIKNAFGYVFDQKPDLVILGIALAEEYCFSFCQEMKTDESTTAIPLLILSNLDTANSKVRAVESGADDFLTTPINKLELMTRVKSLIKLKKLHYELKTRNHELQKTLKKLKKQEQLKENMTQMLVHDLKNPLHSINIGLAVLSDERSGSLTDMQTELIEDSKLNIQTLLSIIGNLLDINRMEENKITLNYSEEDIILIIKEVLKRQEALANDKYLTLEVDCSKETLMINLDRSIMTRIISNIVSNAIKHSYEKSKIIVKIQENTDEITISVIDSGEGIPEIYQKKIFDKFSLVECKKLGFKTDTGLGLYFCNLAVQLHGGKIKVKSKENEGSTFYFTLPKNH